MFFGLWCLIWHFRSSMRQQMLTLPKKPRGHAHSEVFPGIDMASQKLQFARSAFDKDWALSPIFSLLFPLGSDPLLGHQHIGWLPGWLCLNQYQMTIPPFKQMPIQNQTAWRLLVATQKAQKGIERMLERIESRYAARCTLCWIWHWTSKHS